MNFIKRLFNKTTREQPQTIKKNWRVGMWVQTQDNKTGILFKLGDTCEIHIVDRTSGETVKVVSSTGTILFNGTAQIYMPGMEVDTTSILLTGVGK